MVGKKRAIVAGATGLVGRELIRQLCVNDAYDSVTALVRDPDKTTFANASTKLTVRALPSGDEPIEGDELYCAIGTTIKKAGSQAAFRAIDHDLVIDLVMRAKRGGVGRVAVVTAIGSDPNSPIFYSRVKGETERDLRSLNLNRLDIYQPSLLVGKRTEQRLAEGLALMMGPLLGLICNGPLRKYRPITDVALARLMIMGEQLPA